MDDEKKVLIIGDNDQIAEAVKNHPSAQVVENPAERQWDRSLGSAGMLGYLAGMLGPDSLSPLMRRSAPPKEPVPTKCGLPGCEKKSLRDYCCSEHCKEHRAMRKVKG